jgi:hypothetical protein
VIGLFWLVGQNVGRVRVASPVQNGRFYLTVNKQNYENDRKWVEISSNFHENKQKKHDFRCKKHSNTDLVSPHLGKNRSKKAVYVTVTLQILRNVIL